MKTRLNLACGDEILEGYINIDLYNKKAEVRCSVDNLFYEDNSVDEIFASHIIEHADYYEAQRWLKEWYRVLKPGGILIVETPDFFESCKKFIILPEERQYEMYGHFFAKSWKEGEVHKFLYTKRELYGSLNKTGFKNIRFEEPTRYLQNPNIRIIANK